MTKIKICGLRRACDIAYVNEAKPDYIGFVFAKSRRQVSKEEAAELKKLLDPKIQAVGVFVNGEIDTIAELAGEGIIDVIQLHGQEDQAYIETLKSKVSCPIIKAFKCDNGVSKKALDAADTDFYLFDSGAGGTGESFDWEKIPKTDRPWFLAGGLSIENIEKAVREIQPYGVDFSSSVETDGYKDRDKILEIVRRIRNVKR